MHVGDSITIATVTETYLLHNQLRGGHSDGNAFLLQSIKNILIIQRSPKIVKLTLYIKDLVKKEPINYKGH